MKPEKNRIKKKDFLWLLSALAVYGLCFAVNLGGSWFEYGPATVWNLLVTLLYVLFWALFTKWTRRSQRRSRAAVLLAVLTLLGGMLALAASRPHFWFLIIPALVLGPFTAVPMYGLRMFCSWDVTYGLTALLGGLWLLHLLPKKKEAP